MIITNSLKMSFQNLRANKTRSFLTMLGIIIGISSVIIVLSVGAGAQSLIVNQIQSTGSNLIGIMPGGGGDEGPPAAVFGITITTLTDKDREEIEKKSPRSRPRLPTLPQCKQFLGAIRPPTRRSPARTSAIRKFPKANLTRDFFSALKTKKV